MAKSRRVPTRMCAGCGQRLPKQALVRFIAAASGENASSAHKSNGGKLLITIDPQGKGSGRGVYICRRLACFEKAEKRKSLQRKFETAVFDQSLRTEFIRLIEGC